MTIIDSLFMAILNTISPVFGVFGSIVKYITAEEKHAGHQFILDITSLTISSGLIENLVTNAALDRLHDHKFGYIMDQVTPRNELELSCDNCNSFTSHYVRRSGQIICPNCLTSEMESKAESGASVILLSENIYRIHRRLAESNHLIRSELKQNVLKRQKLS